MVKSLLSRLKRSPTLVFDALGYFGRSARWLQIVGDHDDAVSVAQRGIDKYGDKRMRSLEDEIEIAREVIQRDQAIRLEPTFRDGNYKELLEHMGNRYVAEWYGEKLVPGLLESDNVDLAIKAAISSPRDQSQHFLNMILDSTSSGNLDYIVGLIQQECPEARVNSDDKVYFEDEQTLRRSAPLPELSEETQKYLRAMEMERRLKPGGYSSQGFIGEDESLDAVIKQDIEFLTEVGVSTKVIADKLRYFIQEVHNAKKSWLQNRPPGERQPPNTYQITVDGQSFRITWDQFMGLQECPWGDKIISGAKVCPGGVSDSDYMVVNERDQSELRYSGLHPHLIGAHDFFEGKGGYRLDPLQAVLVLDIPTTKNQGKKYKN